MSLQADATDPVYQLAPDAVLQLAEEEAILAKLSDENMYALNASGAAIVRRVAAGEPLSRVIEGLAAMFDADPNDVARDVRDLVAELLLRGLLVARPEGG